MKALVLAKGKKCDWTDRKYIEPIIDYIKNEKIYKIIICGFDNLLKFVKQ